MKTKLLYISVITFICIVHSAVDALGQSEGASAGSGLYVAVDSLFLKRDNSSKSQPIIVSDSTGGTLLSTSELSYDIAAGPRALVGKSLCEHYACEFSYFGINAWQGNRVVSQVNDLDIPGPLVAVANDFDNADSMILNYASRLNNAEINLVRKYGQLSFLSGFRYFNFEDRFDIQSIDNDGDASNFRLKSSNDLFGGQIGIRGATDIRAWEFSVDGRGGVYGNDARQQQVLLDNGNTFLLRSTSASHPRTSFIGDLSIQGSRQLGKNLRFRTGYMCLWASDLALSQDQLDFTDLANSGTTINTDGNLFLHGATTGLEFNW